jgi:hypothetical protein
MLKSGDIKPLIDGITGGSMAGVHIVTFMSEDGGTKLYERPVADGDTCANIVDRGLLGYTPTKESDNYNTYAYSGWATTAGGAASDSALTNVKANRTVYAAFEASTRYYTVRFFDGETLVDTKHVTYGQDAVSTYIKEDHTLVAWTPSPENITADTDCYGEWIEALTFTSASWSKIAEISESGNAKQYFNIGDTKTVQYGNYNYTARIVGFDHDTLADGSGKAGISIMLDETLPTRVVAGTFAEAVTFNTSNFKDEGLASAIKQVTKKIDNGIDSGASVTPLDFNCYIWVPSGKEIGHTDFDGWPTKSYTPLGSTYEWYQNKSSYSNYKKAMVTAPGTYVEWGTRSRQRAGVRIIMTINADGRLDTLKHDDTTTVAYWTIGFCV